MTRNAGVGIYGGTFNPVHVGHLRAAEEVAEILGLDRVTFVPSAQPPHKRASEHDPIAPAEDRLAWVRSAAADNPRFDVDAIEVERGGASFAIETIRSIGCKTAPALPVFIIGHDAFIELGSWREPEMLLTLAHFAVTTRPPVTRPSLSEWLPAVYRDSVEKVAELKALRTKNVKLIVVVRSDKEDAEAAKVATRTLHVPNVRLTRMGRVKVAVLLSFSQRLLKPGEQFVFLSGVAAGGLDTLIVMQVGEEYELLQTIDQPKIDEHVKRVVFERVLEIAVRLAKEGREGKPVGAVFVVGDSGNVRKYCDQNIINPFRGYADDEKNVLDDRISETIREFSLIDGAFIIRGNGTIASAGTHLRPNIPGKPLPQGLGSRHAAAAAITATTHSIAITISESTGTVRVWRRGEMITSIEKAIEPGAGRPSPLMTMAGPE